MRKPAWQKYIDKLTNEDRYQILSSIIGRLIETNEVHFDMDNIDVEERLYWVSSGNDLRDSKNGN